MGDAAFWVADEAPPYAGPTSPESLGGGHRAALLLIVDDAEAAVERAAAAGATVIAPVTEEHGWRLGRIADPFGHHWEVGTPLGPWPGVSAA